MGWDNEQKIAILDEHIKSFDSSDPFEAQISKPILRKVANLKCSDLFIYFYFEFCLQLKLVVHCRVTYPLSFDVGLNF